MGWRLRPVKLHELVNLICDQPASWSAVVILEVVIGEEGPWVGEVLLYHFTNEILTKSNFVLRTSGFQLDFFSLTIGTSSVAASGMRNLDYIFSFSRELVTLAPRADVRHSTRRYAPRSNPHISDVNFATLNSLGNDF